MSIFEEYGAFNELVFYAFITLWVKFSADDIMK